MTPEEEISHIIARQTQAWRRSDAAAFAADCAEDMTFTNIRGETLFGKQAFEQKHASIFASIFAGSTLEITLSRLHFPAPNVAVVDMDCRLSGYKALPPGVAPQPDGCLHTRLLQVLVRAETDWRIVAYHNVDVKPGVLQ
ncbi:MAG: SgcJ/EcaC family oxidoreductase [Anaerolineales bacterium]